MDDTSTYFILFNLGKQLFLTFLNAPIFRQPPQWVIGSVAEFHYARCCCSWYRVLQKKQPSCQTHCEETCMPPSPQVNVVTSLCFERPSKKTAISVRMPACIGQQHWSRGRGGIRCDVTTCRRMAVFFEEPGISGLSVICLLELREKERSRVLVT